MLHLILSLWPDPLQVVHTLGRDIPSQRGHTHAARVQVTACAKQLRSMGFAPDVSERGARQARGDVELATSMLFDGARRIWSKC